MKKLCVIFLCAVALTGCSSVGTFETLGNVLDQQEVPAQQEVVYQLPEDAAAQTMEAECGEMYFCDGYEITVQTLNAGDLDATLRELTGFGRDQLTVMETGLTAAARYECVWTAAGEGGDQVGRAVILDDGNYHYCMTVMADAASAAQLREEWKSLLDSFILG